MDFDISRDYLDGISLGHPPRGSEGKEIKAMGGLHFLPSSPDGTMHTALVSFALRIDGQDKPFAQAAWRFLFTTAKSFDPKAEGADQRVHRSLLLLGSSKIMAVLNNTCMHANLPLIPFDAQRMLQQGAAPAAKA